MIRWFVGHPVAANLLMGMICLLGIAFAPELKRETFPEITPSTVAVRVAYPGASARDVDEEICAPLEDALSGTTGLVELTCLSTDGLAAASAELEEGGNRIEFYNDVFSAVSGINDFPADAETPSVKLGGRSDLIAMLAVSGIDSTQGLKEYADLLSDKLQSVDGVTEALVAGITDRELRVTFDEHALRRFQLSARDIVAAINARSLRQPLGEVQTHSGGLVLRYADARRSVTELQDLILLQTVSGSIVRLGDLATIRIVDADENIQSFINGRQAAILYVNKASEADALRTFERVEAVLEQERAKYPAPFDITITFNMTDLVKERLTLILKNTGMGLILVFGTMWLFFSLRDALWISASLPVSFLGTMFLMQALGLSINMITLVALLMAVGLIMDDSIVIAENISRRRQRHPGPDAAARGTLEVFPGVASSFLTTACVFGPLMFLSGDMGRILQFIPMVLLLTLALSLVEGFLILPHHLAHGGSAASGTARPRLAERLLDRVKENAVIPLAAALVRVRYLTVGSVIAALVLSVGLVTSGQVKVTGFPAIEGDTIQARISLTSGISRQRMVDTVTQLTEALERVNQRLSPRTEAAAPLVERVLVQYATNADVIDNGSNTATIVVDLLTSARRNIAADEVLRLWRQEAGAIPDLVQSSFAQAELGPGGADLEVEIYGRDLARVEAAAGEILSALIAQPAVHEAFQDFYGGRREVQLSLNEYGYSVGLTPQSLADQLRSAFAGSQTDSFRTGVSSVAVQVQLGDSISDLSRLENFPVSVGNGAQTSLVSIADLSLTRSYPAITRKNGLAMARVIGQIDPAGATSSQIAALVETEIWPAIQGRYPDIEIANGGAAADQAKSQSSMLSKLLIGLAGVFMVLAFQFRSYTLPLVVMLSIPFALIGTIVGHWIMGIDLAMPSFIGFASLAGIVVNNAILFLTFFQTHLRGDDHVAAALDAVRARFRPILLSTGTTVVGLLPLISDSSPQVQIMIPLVVAVAAGLVASMVLVVLVLPSLLSIYFDIFPVQRWIEKFDAPAENDAGAAPVRSDRAG